MTLRRRVRFSETVRNIGGTSYRRRPTLSPKRASNCCRREAFSIRYLPIFCDEGVGDGPGINQLFVRSLQFLKTTSMGFFNSDCDVAAGRVGEGITRE